MNTAWCWAAEPLRAWINEKQPGASAPGCNAVGCSRPQQLLLVELQRIELVIPSLLGQQLLMGTLLQNLAVGEHDDLVRVLDGGQPVATMSMVPMFFIFSRES